MWSLIAYLMIWQKEKKNIIAWNNKIKCKETESIRSEKKYKFGKVVSEVSSFVGNPVLI